MLKRLLIIAFLMSQTACGKVASWYAKGFEGKSTASGYIYDSRQYTCASNSHDFGTVLKVTNKENGKSVVVVVKKIPLSTNMEALFLMPENIKNMLKDK